MQKKAIIIGGVKVGIFLILVVAALIAISFTGVSSREVREDEKHLLVTVDILARYTSILGNRSLCKSYIAKHNIDGSLELEYKNDTDEDLEKEEFLFFKSEAEASATIRLAKESFADRIIAYKMG